MKKLLFGFLAFSIVLVLCACGTNQTPVVSEAPAENHGVPSAEANTEADAQGSIDLAGPWHLDSERNDLIAFQDLFPAYAEFGANMEIKSNGQISWYIGADGGSGTYTQDGTTLTADLVTDAEQQPLTVSFQIVLDNETTCLVMEYNGTSVYWIYGISREPSGAGE